jgi:copper(I)-binding protein
VKFQRYLVVGIPLAGVSTLLALLMAGFWPFGSSGTNQNIAIEHAWSKGAVAAGQALPVFLTINNPQGEGDRILSIQSPLATSAVIKRIDSDGALLRATLVDTLEVKSGQRLNLRPGEYQISLMSVTKNIQPGDRIPLTLRFERAGNIEVRVLVENIFEPEHAEHRG